MPQLSETLKTSSHVLNDDLSRDALTVRDALIVGEHVRPLRQVVPLLPGVIEQGSQHFRREVPTH